LGVFFKGTDDSFEDDFFAGWDDPNEKNVLSDEDRCELSVIILLLTDRLIETD
jgi:hypothetical protein